MATLLKKNRLKVFILKVWSFEEIHKRINYINSNFNKFKKIYTNFRHNILILNSEKKFKSTIIDLLVDKS